MIDKNIPDDEFIDLHRNAPRPDAACLYGLIGDIARAGSSDTEANPFAVAAAAMAYLGAAVGRGPYLEVGDDCNPPKLRISAISVKNKSRKHLTYRK